MLAINYLKSVLSIFMFASLAVFSSCTKVGDLDPSLADENILFGKWDVSDKNAAYDSFEFTSDKKYIIAQRVTSLPDETKSSQVQTSQLRADNGESVEIIIVIGDYSSLNQDGNTYTLNLSEFGTIVITMTNETATITIKGETYVVNKMEPIDVSEKTKLVCHTWLSKQIKHIYEDGSFYYDDIAVKSITFTKNGTYMRKLSYERIDETGNETAFGTWEWTKEDKIKISSTVYWGTRDKDGNIMVGTYFESTDYDIIRLTESEFVFSEDIVNAEIVKRESRLYR
ncbi:MAG: hypothetical protein LBL58_10735 [Tannerellaceae bacterium]|jgi:hypothetical protein|nr:hypothetical protein [Tannerellaceae bacterium]